jgi:mRNA interferase MazF
VWLVGLSPIVGHEQAGQRPAIVVSNDAFNAGPTDLVVIVPLTTTRRRTPLHVEVAPPEGGLTAVSFIMCEQVRSVSIQRLSRRIGVLAPTTMTAVAIRLRQLLQL